MVSRSLRGHLVGSMMTGYAYSIPQYTKPICPLVLGCKIGVIACAVTVFRRDSTIILLSQAVEGKCLALAVEVK